MTERRNDASARPRRGRTSREAQAADEAELERLCDEATVRNLNEDRSAFALRDLLSALGLSVGQLQRLDGLSARAKTIVERMDKTIRHAHDEVARRFPRARRPL